MAVRGKKKLVTMICLIKFFIVNARRQYLSNAVLQAKSASNNDGLVASNRGAFDSGLLDLLEGKLAVLQFQIKVKEELEAMATRLEATPGTSESVQNGSAADSRFTGDANLANAAREKAKELSSDLKSITQLYNEYAVPFELWEVRFLAFNPLCFHTPSRILHIKER